MSDDNHREVNLVRTSKGHFRATNNHGVTLAVGESGEEMFTPVQLLLTAIAACTGIDVDYITTKKAEPDQFDVKITAEKVRDDQGNHLVDLNLTFTVTFPEGEGGDQGRDRLPSAVKRSHERLCTVGRTVEIGTPIKATIAGYDEAF